METITLYFRQGSSDKIYQAAIEPKDGGYTVNFAYGRRGSTLSTGTTRRGHMVELVIEDSGPGIATEHLGRIWEPFFTTKAAGKGTGLGLFVTQGVVTRGGGTIRAENRSEGGARFIVQWPIDGTERQSS